MQIIKSTLVRHEVVSGRTNINEFSINLAAAERRTISFFASGLVRTESGADDNSQFMTGFHNTETQNFWSSTFRYVRPGGSFANFAISGAITLGFKDIDIYWRVYAPNAPMRLLNCTLLIGLTEPGIDIEVKSTTIASTQDDDIPVINTDDFAAR